MITPITPKFTITQNNTTINIYHANKDEGLPKHEHKFAHLTMCHSGCCIIRKEGVEFIMTKDTQPVNLTENEWHEIHSLEDNTVFVNIFAEGKY